MGVVGVHLEGERELVARVYYPAAAMDEAKGVPYIWDPDILVPGLAARFADLDARFDEDRLRAMRAHAVADAPLAPGGPFPLVVFSHGKGAALVQNVTRVEDLASHGYVVVGIEHPGGAYATVMPSGRVQRFEELDDDVRVDTWIVDIGSVVERVPSRVAALIAVGKEVVIPSRLGLMGRAFGGTVALRAAARLPAVAAVANLGGPAPATVIVRQPYLQLDPSATAERAREACERATGPTYLVTVDGLGSTGLSDTPYLPWTAPPPVRVVGTIDPLRGAAVSGRTVAAFFDRHLRGDARADLPALASEYPEIRVRKWRV